MQAPARGDRLIVWGLASFHTAFFMALLAMLLYLGGGLGTLLGSLNTLVGLALFGVLWLTTGFTTRQGWRLLNWSFDRPLNYMRLSGVSALWGGLNGMLFLVFLVVVVDATELADTLRVPGLHSPADLAGTLMIIPALLFACGGPIAFIVGALAGLAFALLDSFLIAMARRLVRGAVDPEPPSAG